MLYGGFLLFLLACAPAEEPQKPEGAQLIAQQDLTGFKQGREDLPGVQQAKLDAREERQGWEPRAAELPKYYRTTEGLAEMKQEISAAMSSPPYC
jgi:hypothetical protein